MSQGTPSSDTILLVDDEDSVRRTFREWLDGAGLGCRILAAADAEAALVLANQHTIDLAVLDWNLGAGNDGLQLLEDLSVFNPDVVAILVTGYAHQATPLHAMRMGVRDYLDKNHDLDRDTFLRAVRKQLDRLRPAKRERHLHRSLVSFREAVSKVLPLVQSAAALNDPVPLPHAIRGLLRFLLNTTRARDGVLLARSYDPARDPAETCQAYDAAGNLLRAPLVPFARSLAGTVVSMQEPCSLARLEETAAHHGTELQPFEQGRHSLLAVPVAVAPGIQVVLELFDKQGPEPSAFTPEDARLAAAAADLGAELLRQALAEQHTHALLFESIEAALRATESMAESLRGGTDPRPDAPPPAAVMEQLRETLNANPGATVDAAETLKLAEAVRVLAVRHGPAAVRHCTRLVESVREMLDSVVGS